MKSNLALAVTVALLSIACSANTQPVPTSTPVAPVLVQTRDGSALPIWVSPAAAAAVQFDTRPGTGLQCTIPPFTSVRIVQRDVGYSSAVVAHVASTDDRCDGYVLASLLT